jgi:hypothetical protein
MFPGYFTDCGYYHTEHTFAFRTDSLVVKREFSLSASICRRQEDEKIRPRTEIKSIAKKHILKNIFSRRIVDHSGLSGMERQQAAAR